MLDPFGGTMTTAAAAKKLGRNFIMIEREKIYCEFGQKRLDEILFEDSEVARASFDVKPKKVSMIEMIEAGIFFAGEEFYLKDGKAYAKLNSDGKLLFEGEIIDMHSCAAKVKNLKAKRVNGFEFWYVVRENELVSINLLRENYRQKFPCDTINKI